MAKERKRDMIYIPVWMRLLFYMEKYKEDPLSIISMKLQTTYAWVHAIFKEFEQRGWIEAGKKGRRLTFNLTTKGQKVLKLSKSLINESGNAHLIKK